jgi:hypothetical protein
MHPITVEASPVAVAAELDTRLGQFNEEQIGPRNTLNFVLSVFHDDEMQTVALTDVVDGCDIRMIQRGGRAGFALEALHPFRVSRQVVRENLDRDGPIKPRVPREIHLTHAAGAKQ